MPAPKGVSPSVLRERKLARLADPDIKRWYENVSRGSVITADTYLRSLYLFTDRMKVEPKDLWKLSEEKLHRLLLDFISGEERRGGAGMSTHTHVKSVRSWMAHKGIVISRPIKIRRAMEAATIQDERTPTQEELKRIFMACRARDRVSAALMAHSGVRPEVLGNYRGNDGLRLKDFPDLRIRKNQVEIERTPAMVVVRPELSKAGHRYFTFLTEEGCRYVQEYLNLRGEAGEVLTPDTDLIHQRYEGKAFIHTQNVSDGIRLGIRAAMGRDVKMRPYVLRAYFDTQLLLAESKGKVAHDYRVFWMGHKGSMEARYTTNKGRLSQHFIDDMREAYQRCEEFLNTTSEGSGQSRVSHEVARSMLDLAGYSSEEIDKFDLDDKERVRDLVRERLAKADSPRQEVIATRDLPDRLGKGWGYVDKLNDHQVVVTSPPTGSTSPTHAASRPAPGGSSGPAPPPETSEGGVSVAVSPRSPSASTSPQARTLEETRSLLGWNRRGPQGRGRRAGDEEEDGPGPQGPNQAPEPARGR